MNVGEQVETDGKEDDSNDEDRTANPLQDDDDDDIGVTHQTASIENTNGFTENQPKILHKIS